MLTVSVITNNQINAKRNLSSCYQVHRVSKYIRAQGIQYITKNTVLPHHTHIYATKLNDRKRLIIDRIRHFEQKGSFHYCKAGTEWWLNFLAENGHPISERMFYYDLSHLERLKLIKRNTYETPDGPKRQMYTAWGIGLYKKHWLFRKRYYKGELVVKPQHVYESCADFEAAVEVLNDHYMKTKVADTKKVDTHCSPIMEYLPTVNNKDYYTTKVALNVPKEEKKRALGTQNITEWLEKGSIHVPEEALGDVIRDRTTQLATISAICQRQPWLYGRKAEVVRAFGAIWSLRHDYKSKDIRKNMVSYAIHACLNGYVDDLVARVSQEKDAIKTKTKSYDALMGYLRWGECSDPASAPTLTGRPYAMARDLAAEVGEACKDELAEMNISVEQWGIRYTTSCSDVVVPYKDAYVFSEMVLRAHRYAMPKVKDFLLSKLKPCS